MVVVTLTSDFGTRDAYVAELKAAVLSITRDVHLVDVTHEIPPHDVTAGALVLEAAAPWFPPGTVHVGVVDPGVGTARRGLALLSRGQLFVGPDNGLFTPFLAGADWEAFELRAPEYRRGTVSATFHGRDVFAPAAAHLALGLPPARLGPRLPNPVRLTWPGARARGGALAGVVLHVDRFGNLVTSIREDALAALGPSAAVRVGGRTLRLVRTYGALDPGAAGALVGSQGRLEIAVREGSAAAVLGVRAGTPVRVSRSSRSRTGSTMGSTRPASTTTRPAPKTPRKRS
ncbi:MAG: SAM-dependent chlorinase/fluorinase [Candidatus Rokubacteria bacterium]|nr:SAM-dependent chlorinase/fluorinase [Candidatus Rokubacteria bacterium]